MSGLDPTIYILEGDGERAEIWPAQGFNCYRWLTKGGNLDVLYADAKFLEGSSPTRTGIPVLFPFANRIRDGRFTWDGREYQLPLNDSTKRNAIHGFACRRPWRVIAQGSNSASAWVTGEFHGARDGADCRELWPADYRIRVTYRLGALCLAVEAGADNPDNRPLPCGLGYHPYFRAEDKDGDVQVTARRYWELEESLPSGKRPEVSGMRDLNQPRPLQGLTLDDVLTDLGATTAADMQLRGTIRRAQAEVRVSTSAEFREMVVFTPPHRQAFCIEPYTCTTDAINLSQRGVNAGLTVLSPGEKWTATVELRVS
jgi:aldose 1-epimerase